MKVGFVGLGTMGFPMTKNLIKVGFEVFVFSRSRGPIEKAIELGATEAKTAKELAEQVDYVLTALPMPDDIKKVYFGEEGILAGAKPGTILIDHSTVSPHLNLQIYKNAKEQGVHFLDAPISGGPMGAEAGTLTIMVGGDQEIFEKARPVFEAMGKTILYMGKTGNGSTAKLINNMLVGIHTAALSEAFVLGAKAGIGIDALYDVLKTSTGRSYMIDRCYPLIKERDFQQRFMIDLLYKDMGLVTDLADRILVPVQLAKLAQEMIGEAKESGYGHEDVAATIKPLEKKAHTEVK
ncbi:NAD(P)-dependent oxidoreductase [Tepidibacillus fermentans]|uniref:3-hydroxyisobutyrate dehydrogenase/2-hydroxy-3-oxopropionate reductase n=1 Tax=Tepidibacillus fermentans TaxID=1281767 RepID=A0A4R3KKM8_9BACI|nr:NAD(P)-dependent oxidoreductase [Tepidibacillus fermentans]TCS84443.1 3-hydroxyisobutyrate dehydrogenase/2-hydroxy-3-oxopropionate reductase [Tepidibacillus fermentans]